MEPVTVERLYRDLGHGGEVRWVNREATRVGDLRIYGRLVISGPPGIGKTREAVELIRRAIAEDLITKNRIYRPGPGWHFLNIEGVKRDLEQQFHPHTPALLFVDDLFRSSSPTEQLDRLAAAMNAMKVCQAAYVIVTVRADQLTDADRATLTTRGFHIVDLRSLDAQEAYELVENTASQFKLRVDDAAARKFVQSAEGTPLRIVMGLLRLQADGVTRVGKTLAQSVARASSAEFWAELRRYITGRMPPAEPLFRALATFRVSGVRTYTPLVLEYALHLWRRSDGGKGPPRRMDALREALGYLAHFDVIESDTITAPDSLVEGLFPDTTAAEEAREHLGTFLLRHRRWFHNRWLRRFHGAADVHRWALFDLALGLQSRREFRDAIRFYSAAAAVKPHPGVYNNRGTVRLALGDLQKALADYNQAIRLDPKLAAAYFNRGLARLALGDLRTALTDYDQAIQLDPDYAAAYNNRGIVRQELGNLQAALEDYDQAIRLDPDYADAYNNRGLVRQALGDLQVALADFDQAIHLDPDDVDPYFNRGNVRRALGDLQAALADYDQAIHLDPENADAHSWRGTLLRAQAKWAEAHIAHRRALELDPQRARDWLAVADLARRDGNEAAWQEALTKVRGLPDDSDLYNRACFESVAGNTVTALTLLEEALTQEPGRKVWARQEPDLSWLHEEPRFWEIVGDQKK